MSTYTYDDMSPREFRHAWAADALARDCRCNELAAADRESDRIRAMSVSELRNHIEGQGLTVAGEAAKARAAFRQAEMVTPAWRRGLCLVLVGPSGSGKSTIMRNLLRREHRLRPSISVTTRKPRAGEVPSEEYYFLSRREFSQLEKSGGLAEHTEYAGERYGTRRRETKFLLGGGIDLVFVLDAAGCAALQAALPGDVVGVFIEPPGQEVLRDRLLARGDQVESIERRMAVDSQLWTAGQWCCEHSVVNGNLSAAVHKVCGILHQARDDRWAGPDGLSILSGVLDALGMLTEECGV